MRQKRIRDYGVALDTLPTGPLNKITDVPGVLVGHCTIDTPQHKTGVTMLLPRPENPFTHQYPAASFVLNGFGKSIGLLQIHTAA
ncbi:MAG: P1 family peptidase, partial [Clostridiales bacterium]|nr:P1 family peptidase [Clostridiales bacterium]